MTRPPAAQATNYAEVLDFPTKRLILIGVLLGLFLSALDQTIVSTALPKIVADLQGLNLYAWVTTAYLLVSTALLPIYGKLSDIYGRKPVLMFGIAVFLIGSMLCGAAGEPFLGNLFGGGMMQLIVFRGLQGVGAAALTSIAFAIIADLFAPADRARYQGLFGAVFGLSSVIGPLLGGFLTDNISWRWVFYVNVPIGLVALSFIATRMPILASGLKPKIDLLGSVLIVLFSVPLLLALTWGSDSVYSWTSPTILGLFALSAASLVAFLFAEARHESPVLPLTLFRNPTFTWSVIARFLIGAGFLGAILFLSLYLVNVKGVTATAAGTATIPLTMGIIAGAIGSGQVASRVGYYKFLMLGGLAVATVAFWWLSTMNVDTPYWAVVARMVALGLGLGPALPLYTLALQNAVKPYEIGVATSSGTFFQQMGSTMGAAVFGAILTAGLTSEFKANLAEVQRSAPFALQSQIAPFGQAEGGTRPGFDPATVRAQAEAGVREAFGRQRDLVTRALRERDPAAIARLREDERTPENVRGLLSQLSAAGQVPAGSETANAASEQALRGALASLSQAETQALAQTGTTIDRISRAVKVSFANAISRIYLISILIGLAAFLVTLALPNLRLPKRGEKSGEDRPQVPVAEV
ncbi:MDR family MFS transporter [Deinococcus peraridilitoris]|uniref:Drug resistance transporter, EmrB/QacA subfamily n=1 Tax=Deinococcus peraridilitoris (strain DSM 19664 / LMG 22246 / CIP 109416 / KR-200) TaxID=937777 RepID=K9ZVQ9_DEIPD|nr:MDR family MFS transporter [Deinococcus peraridilitoris]AFZ65703.1 drug resistance transporter, EmrB/QacA subfamily [Deinococcus peraridilitoris DSM 19664]